VARVSDHLIARHGIPKGRGPPAGAVSTAQVRRHCLIVHSVITGPAREQSSMTDRITIRRPDDWHLHVRDGEMLRAVLPYTAKVFGRAILMPNLVPPHRAR